MKNSLTVYAENEDQLTKLKAIMLSLDISFKENLQITAEREEITEEVEV